MSLTDKGRRAEYIEGLQAAGRWCAVAHLGVLQQRGKCQLPELVQFIQYFSNSVKRAE